MLVSSQSEFYNISTYKKIFLKKSFPKASPKSISHFGRNQLKLKGNSQHDNTAKDELTQEIIPITESHNHLIIESNDDITTSIADTTITTSATTPGDILAGGFTAI